MVLALAEAELLAEPDCGFRLPEGGAELGHGRKEQAYAGDAVVGLDDVHHVLPVLAEVHLLGHAAVVPVVQQHYYRVFVLEYAVMRQGAPGAELYGEVAGLYGALAVEGDIDEPEAAVGGDFQPLAPVGYKALAGV